MNDSAQVFQVLSFFPDGLSIRLIAEALQWKGGRRVLNTARVHRALLELAADRRVEMDNIRKRWRVVKRS